METKDSSKDEKPVEETLFITGGPVKQMNSVDLNASSPKLDADDAHGESSDNLDAGSAEGDTTDKVDADYSRGESAEKVDAGEIHGESIENVDADEAHGEAADTVDDDNAHGESIEKVNADICHGESTDSVDADKTHDESTDSADIDSVPKALEAELGNDEKEKDSDDKTKEGLIVKFKDQEDSQETPLEDHDHEPVSDGTEIPGMEANGSPSTRSLDLDLDTQKVVEKAVALKNLVKEKGEKGASAVSNFLRRLSGRKDEDGQDEAENPDKNISESPEENSAEEVPQKTSEKSAWNPLSYLIMSRDADGGNGKEVVAAGPPPHIAIRGRIVLYTRIGCKDSREIRLILHGKRLKYVEINVDVYPSRKAELEKIAGSSSVPKLFFNEILIGGLTELKSLDESGKINEKIDYLVNEAPSFEAPLPPLSGEDDLSNSGALDELALIVKKMKETIVLKDRLYKVRWFTSCFLGSEAVDFLSEDQYLEREEAVEYGRKLALQLFFQHVTGENLFEDGNHLYRFLDNDPTVSLCHNIPRGIIDVKPKPITEIASRLRFLSYAIFEAYTSEDGKHVDYISIHGSEEFARYLRIVEELQRVELAELSREEKLAFFINLHNMMVIHSIFVCGHRTGTLERTKLYGDFRYVIGGSTYSLSEIQNGILRGNRRPPYNLMKPYSAKDKRVKVALSSPEPLVHFTLVYGNQSGPALRCYSPANIDNELKEAAINFLGSGGLIVDLQAKTASASKIIKWFSVDFGNNETEVLKYLSKYLDPAVAEGLLDILVNSQVKVTYQVYDWRLNC